MHSASCPTCGTAVEFYFQPVAGLVWCPACQKMFSPPPAPAETPKTSPIERPDARNGTGG